jgi:hypothetical protein
MHARLPHSLMVFALVCGASLVPRGAAAATPTCECTSTTAGPMTECDAIDGARCEAIEDCTSIVPLSRPADVIALAMRADAALMDTPLRPSAKLSWCESAADPECQQADPERRPDTTVVVSVSASLLPDVFTMSPFGALVTRSHEHNEYASRLVGNEPTERLDRPPR